MHAHEARAQPLGAAEIVVADGLVDAAFAAQCRLLGLHGDAVGLHAAIAAALANLGMDEQPLLGVRQLAALAQAAALGGAGLVVDDRGDARDSRNSRCTSSSVSR